MKLSIIIPVFNEEKTLERAIKKVFKASILDFEKEIIVVDDKSTDKSLEILKKIKGIKLLEHKKNFGKGKAIQTALKCVTGDYILIQDADLEYDPNDYSILLKDLNGVVYGSRNINPENRGYFIFVLGVRFLTSFINLIFNKKLTDSYTCYKLFPVDVLKSLNLKSSGFEIEAEITVKLLKKKINIKEVPIHYYPRKFKQGKKIKIKDGLKGFFTILKYM
ncbi:glycosyltransferase family 2 protein [Patescibacteria group bacterium]|nr:glycosyltransferase family 2 protein [Patescibacteria group bacterium]